jgi:hypothetical protein
MGLGQVVFDANGLATCGNRLVELTLLMECGTEVGMGLGIVWFDADGLETCRDGLVELVLSFNTLPRLE